MANGNGTAEWLKTILPWLIAIIASTALVVGHVRDTGIHQTPEVKAKAVEKVVADKMAPIERDIYYIRANLQEIKQTLKELREADDR